MTHPSIARANSFCAKFNLQIPVLMAPMAGACPAPLASAVCNAGGMGACGVLLLEPSGIEDWVAKLRASTNGSFQLNNWIPDPAPHRDAVHEAKVREFLGNWGPAVSEDAADKLGPDFAAQCRAMVAARPTVISSIMGLYDRDMVAAMKSAGIAWFATVTTVAEARAAVAAGADVVVAQGMEAGGHRGAFNAADAEGNLIGLFSLLPAVVDAVDVPVVATGGIADSRGVAAALLLGASAVQIGTALLRTPEAGISPTWADAIGRAQPEDTIGTRAFSGRLGRSLKTAYTLAAAQPESPHPAPYPVQRALTGAMRGAAGKAADLDSMQVWAGQSGGLAQVGPAMDRVSEIWREAVELLG